MNATMNAPELGALLRISDRAVREMAKAGHIVSVAPGKYDVAKNVPPTASIFARLATGRGREAAINIGSMAPRLVYLHYQGFRRLEVLAGRPVGSPVGSSNNMWLRGTCRREPDGPQHHR